MTTYSEAISEICSKFESVFPHYIIWENTDGEIPKTNDPWAMVRIQHTDGGVAALGSRLYRYSGTAFFYLFIIAGRGIAPLIPLVTAVKNEFEGSRPPEGVWFSNVRINEIGVNNRWFQVNVLADFEYDEVKNG